VYTRYLAPNAVRITHATLDGGPPVDRPWLSHILLAQDEIPASRVELRVRLEHNCVQILAGDQEVLREAIPPRLNIQRRQPYLSLDIPKAEFRLGLRRSQDGIRLALKISPAEAFYGWGEWFNAFRRTQGHLHLRIRDAVALLQDRATYSAIPLFFSSRGYAFWLLNSHTSCWQIDSQRGILHIEADGPGADYILIYGPSFKRILETYTTLTGRPPLLPRWAFGLWGTSYPQGHQDGVLAHIQEHRRRQIPLDALILDYHWEEGFHNFRWRALCSRSRWLHRRAEISVCAWD
jgi:alpha-glucosidase (family GH31 glycosyl hydrolase)